MYFVYAHVYQAGTLQRPSSTVDTINGMWPMPDHDDLHRWLKDIEAKMKERYEMAHLGQYKVQVVNLNKLS